MKNDNEKKRPSAICRPLPKFCRLPLLLFFFFFSFVLWLLLSMEGEKREKRVPPLPGAVIIKQGAEGRIYEGMFLGKPTLVKERFSKAYRHPTLDVKLTQKRLQSEVRSITKCTKIGIDVPTLYFIDTTKNLIFMEKVEGMTVRDVIFSLQSPSSSSSGSASGPVYDCLAQKIGEALGKLHASDIVHGDLTTSNMILRPSSSSSSFSPSPSSPPTTPPLTPETIPSSSLVMIDFGLSSITKAAEDKAVDLYVLERAFLSTHPNTEEFFDKIIDVYGKVSPTSKATLTRLEAVRARGRKKLCFG